MKTLIVLLLLTNICSALGSFREFQDFVRAHNILGENAAKRCVENIKAHRLIVTGIFAAVGFLLMGPLAAAVAPAGLYGAAAYSAGLKIIGFGVSMKVGTMVIAGVTLGTAHLAVPDGGCNLETVYYDIIRSANGRVIYSGKFVNNVPADAKGYHGSD